MAIIRIMNLRRDKIIYPYDVRADRKSVLGNPFTFNLKLVDNRDKSCDLYEEYIQDIFKCKDSLQYDELERLLSIYKRYNKLNLFCWCAPLRCHTESIRKIILIMRSI